ncbi:MAG TPA: cache domain-containing protein [Chloroflexota bacterium]|nr:cache domain-containing protein [Chloroflexota bacterium]
MHTPTRIPVRPPRNPRSFHSTYWQIPLSLRTKLLIAIALILLPTTALVLAGDVRDFGTTRAAILASDSSTAETVGTMVDATLDDAISVGQTIANAPTVRTMDPSRMDPYFDRLIPILLQFRTIAVVNLRGDVIESTTTGLATPSIFNVSDRQYFQQAIAYNMPRISNIIIGRETHRPISVAAVPIRDQADNPIGAVALAVNLEYFRARLWNVPLSSGRVIVITDPSGQLAFISDRWEVAQTPPNLSSATLIQDAIRGLPATQDSGSFPLLTGSQTGTAIVTPRYHWIVAVLQPTIVTNATTSRRIALDVASFALALAIGLLSVYFLSRQLIGPILELDRAARDWSQGHLDRHVSIRTGDELEALGNSLNQMVDSWAQTLEQLADTDQRLLRERNRLQTIFETSPVGIVVLDQSGEVTDVNPTAEALLGQPFIKDLPPDRWPEQYHMYHPDGTLFKVSELPSLQALREGRETAGVEMVIRRPNGWQAHLLANSAPVRQENGAIMGSVTIFLDITPFVEEERLRSEFVESAAHEFRSPLTVIKGYAEVAMRDPTIKNARVERELSMIVDASDRASRLADELLRAAQLHLPPLLLHRQLVDLSPLVNQTVAKQKRLPGGDKYQFRVTTVPVEVEGDAALLEEALTDILSQAEAAMPLGGPIEVVVSAWDGMSSVRVTDHGPEIPPDRIATLFQPFTVPNPAQPQVSLRPTLLLYLARRIIEESGGWIRAESTPQATTISISLPRRFRSASAAGPTSSARNGRPPRPAISPNQRSE